MCDLTFHAHHTSVQPSFSFCLGFESKVKGSLFGERWLVPRRRGLGEADGPTRPFVALQRPSFDVQTFLHFTQAKARTEDDWEAACSSFLPCLSFAASCLPSLSLRLSFLTNELQLSRSEAFCCNDGWMIPMCAIRLFS